MKLPELRRPGYYAVLLAALGVLTVIISLVPQRDDHWVTLGIGLVTLGGGLYLYLSGHDPARPRHGKDS